MPTQRQHQSLIHRFFIVPAIIASSIMALTELGRFVPRRNPVSVEAATASRSIATYGWNLSDDDLPLLNLPDHIGAGVDLSLTFSMNRFQFPLFQSLYYNRQVGKYILMLIPNEGRRAEFIDLYPVEGWGQFKAADSFGLRLSDRGAVKLLSASDGTTYKFATLADGEPHCSQIKDRNGVVINLRYTGNASIDTISDASGRAINFSYTENYLSSITQTWGSSIAKLRKTWAVSGDPGLVSRPAVKYFPVPAIISKHIPTNALQPRYTEQMVASDWMLATLFGGPAAVAAANGFEPGGLGRQYPLYRGDLIGDDGKLRRGHLSYAMHLYGNPEGTGITELYVPLGFISHSNTPTPTDAAITFYYPMLGNLSDVTLAVFHIADFRISYESGRVRIGNIGGRGGSIASYRHSHIEFYRGNTGLPSSGMRAKLRIDPAIVFETTPGFIAKSQR